MGLIFPAISDTKLIKWFEIKISWYISITVYIQVLLTTRSYWSFKFILTD
jgi:hypothetical protein